MATAGVAARPLPSEVGRCEHEEPCQRVDVAVGPRQQRLLVGGKDLRPIWMTDRQTGGSGIFERSRRELIGHPVHATTLGREAGRIAGRASRPTNRSDMAERMQERFDRALAVPLLAFLGVAANDASDPRAGLHFIVGRDSLNAADALHGGAIATALDVAAYLAVLPDLEDSEEALTHAFSASYIAGAAEGERVEARASVLRRGRHLAFVSGELQTDDRLLATASVTKSIRPIGGNAR